ncbi:MAG: serine hydrolase [Ignavibacteria bacterium]
MDIAGKPPEFYAAGWHDRKNKIPAYPEALFKIASISKLYVAVSVAKLVNEKQLSLDKTLQITCGTFGKIDNADKLHYG